MSLSLCVKENLKGMRDFNTESQRHRGAEMEENDISQIVLDAAITVHRTLGGPGLLE